MGWFGVFACLLVGYCGVGSAQTLGDIDGDGATTVLDVIQALKFQREGTDGVPLGTQVIADATQDGVINAGDARRIAETAVGLISEETLPLSTVRRTSPSEGEDGVAVTRESVFYFTQPLALDAVLSRTNFHAHAAGRQLLTRAEWNDRRDAVFLFFLEPIPGRSSVRVTLDGSDLRDFLGRPVDLDGDGVGGGVRTLEFETLSVTPIVDTSVSGRVFASELQPGPGGSPPLNIPLEGVTISVDGMEESLRTVTDSLGRFRLDPSPAGAFFVHIDGRTVTNEASGIRYPDLAYYPFVGKRWVAVAGQETSVGDIFLPLIPAGTLLAVQADEPTLVTMPASVLESNPDFEGVSLLVPSGALLSESGQRGGRVGMAPVHPDRLPGPLPPGVSPTEVITIQTDGAANFSQPVPACFPNRPDPETGERLPPGASSALWSFNHDTGRFEIVGSMTVSDDGLLVCTDPGVGILAPGWHFTRQGTVANGAGQDCGPSGPDSRKEPGTSSQPRAQPGKRPCPRPSSQARSQSSAGDPVQLFSGEFTEEMTDLWLPGRGIDFEWTRTYRSSTGRLTAQGHGWDHPYHLRIEEVGLDLELSEGTGRTDVYMRQSDGTWSRPEFFRVIRRMNDGTFELTFPDRAQWLFNPLGASSGAGAVSAIVDRFGNRMDFSYDGFGRLEVITDTLGHEIVISYNADGFIQTVTDHVGRQVRYTYYGHGEVGGSFGDLRSVTSPSVEGTSTGNDFDEGKTVTYTYTTGVSRSCWSWLIPEEVVVVVFDEDAQAQEMIDAEFFPELAAATKSLLELFAQGFNGATSSG